MHGTNRHDPQPDRGNGPPEARDDRTIPGARFRSTVRPARTTVSLCGRHRGGMPGRVPGSARVSSRKADVALR